MYIIRVAGFEPTTSCSQNRRATKLRYTLSFLKDMCFIFFFSKKNQDACILIF